MTIMEQPITTSDGARLAWDVSGSGPPVLFVHGIGYTRSKWDPQIDAVVRAGFQAFRYDLRGFGDSTSSAETEEVCASAARTCEVRAGGVQPAVMDHFLADMIAVVDHVGLERFHLVGHSLGGMIAQRYVTAHPTRVHSLTLVSTTSHNGRRGSAFARLMVELAEHGFDAVMSDPELRERADAILAEAFPAGVALSMLRPGMERPNAARANAWRACIGFSAKDDIARLTCPVLVAHGTADRLIPFRAGELVHLGIPSSKWLVEEGAGHSLPSQRAESFNRALVDFLKRAEDRH